VDDRHGAAGDDHQREGERLRLARPRGRGHPASDLDLALLVPWQARFERLALPELRGDLELVAECPVELAVLDPERGLVHCTEVVAYGSTLYVGDRDGSASVSTRWRVSVSCCVLFLIEVADTSLERDRGVKLALYAAGASPSSGCSISPAIDSGWRRDREDASTPMSRRSAVRRRYEMASPKERRQARLGDPLGSAAVAFSRGPIRGARRRRRMPSLYGGERTTAGRHRSGPWLKGHAPRRPPPRASSPPRARLSE
jgi:hypothetical protein